MHQRPPYARAHAAAIACVAAGALLVTPAAADPTGEPPGNRGTVKIHDAATPDADRRDEPHVCEFRIVGFGFPADSDLVITIAGHGGPNAGPGTFATTLGAGGLDADGDWAIAGPTLADGMYKLEIENTTAPGGAKQKVFHVECPDDEVVTDEEPAVVETTTTSTTTSSTTSTSTTSTSTTSTTAALLPGETVLPGVAEPGRGLVLGARGERGTEVLAVAPATAARADRSALAFSGATVAGLVLLGVGLVAAGLLARRRGTTCGEV